MTPLEDSAVLAIASRLSKSPAQVVLRWGLQTGSIVIPKSVTPSRIVENSQIFDFELSEEDLAALGNGLTQQRLVNPDFRADGEPVFPYEFN